MNGVKIIFGYLSKILSHQRIRFHTHTRTPYTQNELSAKIRTVLVEMKSKRAYDSNDLILLQSHTDSSQLTGTASFLKDINSSSNNNNHKQNEIKLQTISR